MLIRISQCRTLRWLDDPPLLQTPFTTAQSSRDLSQRLGVGQLTKQHCDKLVPACKPSRMPLGFCLFHLFFKLVSRKNLEKLIHDAAKSFHGAEPPVGSKCWLHS